MSQRSSGTDDVLGSVRAYSKIGKNTRRYPWKLVIILLVIAILFLVSGAIAVALNFPDAIKENIFDYAQVLGGAGTVLMSIGAYWREIKQKYTFLRLQHIRDHVVVCGLGEKGRLIVETYLEKGYRVAVIESIKDHPEVAGCWERGVAVITGDATDLGILDVANSSRAKLIFAVTGNDSVNLEIANKAKMMIKTVIETGENVVSRCFCHVSSDGVREIFSHHDLFEKADGGFDASIFSVDYGAARFLLEKYPPDIAARANLNNDGVMRILVVGFAGIGEALVKQVARVGHYLEWKSLEVTIVADCLAVASECFMASLATHGNVLVPGVSVRFIDNPPNTISNLAGLGFDDTTLPVIVYVSGKDDPEAVSLSLHMHKILGRNNGITIVACMKSGLSKLMEHDSFKFIKDRSIKIFNIAAFACAHPVLLEESTDIIARLIHSSYFRKEILYREADFVSLSTSSGHARDKLIQVLPHIQHGDMQPLDAINSILYLPKLSQLLASYITSGTSEIVSPLLKYSYSSKNDSEQTEDLMRLNSAILAAVFPEVFPDKLSINRSLLGWDDQTEDNKESNRWQADHLNIKLRTMGFDAEGTDVLDRVAEKPELLDRFAEMEHRRWQAALLIDGWTYAPGDNKDSMKKTHPCLIPFDQLSDQDKSKDADAIRNIRNLVMSPEWVKYKAFLG